MSGQPVATGVITLDRDKAKEKLRRFQLVDPCAWLLELVRAAVAQGATAVIVRTDADDVRVSFDGVAFTLADVEDLYEALLARRAPPARQHLAVAVNGALALAPRFVELLSRDERGGVRLRLVPGKPDEYAELQDDKTERGTSLWLRHPFRAGAFFEFFRARLGTQRELRALREGCRFLQVPISINGRVHSFVPPAEHARAVKGRSGDGLVFPVPDRADPPGGRLFFTFRGVVLEELAHALMPAGLCAVLPGDQLTRDASLAAFVRDDGWADAVDGALIAALELCEQAGSELLQAGAYAFGPAVLAGSIAMLGSGGHPLAGLPKLAAALARRPRPLLDQPVLRDVNGQDVTLANLRSIAARSGGQVPVARRPSLVPHTTVSIVQVGNEREMALATHYLGARVTDGETLLALAERRHRGQKRLRQRAAPLQLHPGEALGSARFTAKLARGIVALRPAGTRLKLSLFADGCLIGMHELDCPVAGLSMAIEAKFKLTPDCTNVEHDATFTRALRMAFAKVPDALANACAQQPPHLALPSRALPLLAWALDAEALWRKLVGGLNCPSLADLPPLAPLVLDGPHRHPVCALACIPRVDGTFTSLNALRGQLVPVVPQETEHFSMPQAIRGGEVLRAVLARVASVSSLDEQARRELWRARLLRKLPRLREPPAPAVSFSAGSARGWVSFGGGRPGVLLAAHLEGRAVTPVHFSSVQLGSLRVTVDDPQLMPLSGGAIAARDARRLARAGLAAAGELIDGAIADGGARARGRSLALSILTMIAPSEALARAAELLPADEFLSLRALSLTNASAELDALIELALEPGNVPTVALIRELAQAAGTKLPRRGVSDADPRAFALAPLGGLSALRGQDQQLPLRARVLRQLPGLAALELRTVGATTTLQRVIDRGAPVRYVARDFVIPDSATPADDLLILSAKEERALRALLGPSSISDVSNQLREQAARLVHEAKPREDARIDRAVHVGVTKLVAGEARGELGLLPPTSLTPAAHLRILVSGRFFKRVELSTLAPCSFAAIIDDPQMPVSEQGPAAVERVGVLAAGCLAAAEQALDQLTAAQPPERPDAKACACLLERLSHHDRLAIDLQRLGRLSQAPLLEDIDGRWLSFDQILAEVQRNKSVASVAFAPPGDPPRRPVLLVPVLLYRELLTRAGARVEDITASWQSQTDRVAMLERLPPMPTPPSDAFAVAAASVAGVRATLWAGPSTYGAHLFGGLAGRQVDAVPFSTVLPAVEGTLSGQGVVDSTLTFVLLTRAMPAIDVAAASLATSMVARARVDDAPMAAREWCRKLALALAASPDAHGKRLVTLLAVLRALPLFPAPDAGLLTLDQVLASRPECFEAELMDAGLTPALTITAPLAAATPAPEAELSERLTELLALLALDEDTHAQLARWPLLLVCRAGKRLVRFSRTHCELDLEHEIGRAALTGDYAALDLLAAAVVGAANHHLDELDQRHEREFLGRLLALAATRGS